VNNNANTPLAGGEGELLQNRVPIDFIREVKSKAVDLCRADYNISPVIL